MQSTPAQINHFIQRMTGLEYAYASVLDHNFGPLGNNVPRVHQWVYLNDLGALRNAAPFLRLVGLIGGYAPEIFRCQDIEDTLATCFGVVRTSDISWRELAKRDIAYRLAPIHLAAIKGNLEALDLLIYCGVNAAARDHMDWTAAHHAAVRSDGLSLVKLFRYDDRLANRQNRFNGTPLDLLTRVSLPMSQEATQVFIWDSKQNTAVPKKVSEIPHLAQHFFTPEGGVFTEPKVLIREWTVEKPSKLSSNPIDRAFRCGYHAFRKNPPMLFISDTASDDRGRPMNNIGHFTCAGQNLKPCIPCCEYGGEDIAEFSEDRTDYEYAVSDIDGRPVRSYAAMMADGFPNALLMTLSKIRGRPTRTLIIPLYPIQPGEPICIDYGPDHQTKVTHHIESRGAALREFAKEFRIRQWIGGDNDFNTMRAKNLVAEQVDVGFSYILNTPTAYIVLVLEALVELADLVALRKYYIRINRSEQWETIPLETLLGELMKYLGKLPEPYRVELTRRLVDITEEGNIPLMFKVLTDIALDEIGCFQKEGSLDRELTQATFKKRLERYLLHISRQFRSSSDEKCDNTH